MADNTNGEDPKKCELCQRQGLPIYLTRVSVYDKIQGVNGPQPVPASLAPQVAKYNFHGACPSLRGIRTGYVYVFVKKYKGIAKKEWQVFRVQANGLIQRIPFDDRLKSIAACSRAADNMNPRFLVLHDANHLGSVQLAFSEHAWTQHTMDAYAKDDGLRGKRMQEINVTDWVQSQAAPAGGQAFDANFLATHVGFWCATKDKLSEQDALKAANEDDTEYADTSKSVSENKMLAGTRYASTECTIDKLPDLDKAQQAIQSKAGLHGKALLFVIDDPIGLAADLNSLRTYKIRQKFNWMGGGRGLSKDQGPDADRPHKKQSAELIDQVMQAKYQQTEQQGEDEKRSVGDMDYSAMDGGGLMMEPPPEATDEEIKAAGKEKADDKQKRMKKRYDAAAMDTFVKSYDKAFKAWDSYIEKFDQDWAGWVSANQSHIDVVLTNDCDHNNARDLVALRNYTGDIYAGPVLSEASVKLYAKAYAAKTITNTNWIMSSLGLNNQSLLGELTKELGSSDSQADMGARLYDILKRSIENIQEAPAAWKEYHQAVAESKGGHAATSQGHGNGATAGTGEATSTGIAEAVIATDPLASKLVLFEQNTEMLLYTGAEMMARMADAARAGKPIGGVDLSLMDVGYLQQRLFRFGAVNYAVTKGDFLFTATVELEIPQFLNATNAASALVQADLATMRALDRINKTSKTGAEALEHARGFVQMMEKPGSPKITSTILVKSPLVNSKGGNIQVSAGGPMGTKSQGLILVNEETIVAQMAAPNAPATAHAAAEAVKAPGAFKYGLSGVVFVFQAWVLFKAVNDIYQKRGFEQTQAILSATSAVLAMGSAGSEIAALWRTTAAASASKAGEEGEAAVIALKLSANKFAFGAGLLSAASCTVDAIAMFLKAAAKKNTNHDAFVGYFASGSAFAASSFATASGSYLAYVAKGGQLGRQLVVDAATQIAERQVAGAAAEEAAAVVVTEDVALAGVGMVASWFTGIGLVLTIVGVAWYLWASMMEDDDAEALLRRTWWGIKDADPKFATLDLEMKAYYQYQFGVQVALNMDRPWYALGVVAGVDVSIKAGYFAANLSICDFQVVLDGKTISQGSYTGGTLPEHFKGGMKPVPDVADMFFLDLEGEIPFDSGNAQNVSVTYSVRPQGFSGPVISGTLQSPVMSPDLSHMAI